METELELNQSLDGMICQAIIFAKAQSKSRERSLVITKLQEARMWLHEDTITR